MTFFEFMTAHGFFLLGGVLAGALLGFVAVILVRTLRFRPAAAEATEHAPVSFDLDRATSCLADLVRCKTDYKSKAHINKYVTNVAVNGSAAKHIHLMDFIALRKRRYRVKYITRR